MACFNNGRNSWQARAFSRTFPAGFVSSRIGSCTDVSPQKSACVQLDADERRGHDEASYLFSSITLCPLRSSLHSLLFAAADW